MVLLVLQDALLLRQLVLLENMVIGANMRATPFIKEQTGLTTIGSTRLVLHMQYL